MKNKIIIAILIGLGLCIVLRGFSPEKHQADFDFDTFAQLPVLKGGRVKPLDSVARNSLLLFRGKQSVYKDKEKFTAIEWLANLMFKPREANDFKVFRIINDQVLGIIKEKQGDKKDFSYNDLQEHFEEIGKQAKQAAEQKHELRTPFQKEILKLDQSVKRYLEFTHSVHFPATPGGIEESYDAYLRAIPEAIASMQTQGMDIDQNDPAFMRFRAFYGLFQESFQPRMQPIPPVPDGDETTKGWHSLSKSLIGNTIVDAIKKTDIDEVARGYAKLVDAYHANDVEKFNSAVKILHTTLITRSQGKAEKVGIETFFNRYQPFYICTQLYVLMFLVVCFSWLGWEKPLGTAAFWILIIAFVIHTIGLGGRMYIQSRPPVTTLYSSAIFIGWVATLLSVILEKIYRNGIGSAVAGMIGFSTLIIAHNLILATPGDTFELMRAVLDSNFWLATHVVTITMGYGATYLAGFLAIVFVARGILSDGLDNETAKSITSMVYGITCFALLFSFVGTILGGIWADQSWGRFWGWDPKENGALMIVIWNAVILHARWGGLVKRRGIMNLVIFGNVITSWSWFGTNMLGVGLHNYGFMDKAFIVLMVFCLSQFIIIAIGTFWPTHLWRSQEALGRRKSLQAKPQPAQPDN